MEMPAREGVRQASAAGDAQHLKSAAQLRAFATVDAQLSAMRTSDPKGAIDAYKHYWETNPDLVPDITARVAIRVARIYDLDLKDDKNALATCDWAIAELHADRDRIRPIACKAQILTALLRTDEAQALIEKNWSLMMISGPAFAGPMLDTYTEAMEQQLKSEVAEAALKAAFRKTPLYLGDEDWSSGVPLYDTLIDDYIKHDQLSQAFRWTKLRFVLCPFTQAAITRATDELIAINESSAHPVHAAKSTSSGASAPAVSAAPDVIKRRVFGELTADPAPAAPLAAPAVGPVSVPVDFAALKSRLRTETAPEDAFDPAAIDERLKAVGRKTEQQRIERITLLLASGRYRTAMDEALEYRKELPGSPNGIKQIARVFKAADLDVARANDFVRFTLHKTGTDPIPTFLAQFPQDDGGIPANNPSSVPL